MVTLEIALVLLLILLNAFFAMSELAIVSARRARLQQRADMGSAGARTALQLSDDPTRLLSTVQIGITSVGILTGAFSGATIAESLAADLEGFGFSSTTAEPLAIGIVVLILTFLTLVFGELVPKRLALAHADAIAARVAPIINLVARSAHPAVAVLQWATHAAARLFGVHSSSKEAGVTDEEINSLIAEGTQQGIIQPAERAMVEEVLRLADRPVRTIMTHRTAIVWLDVNDSLEEVRLKIAEGGFSRLPICENDLDHCIGYVRMRDIADRLLAGQPLELATLAREPLTVSENLKALDLMVMFRRARPHVALVADEYGSILGIVTPTDVLETITGEFSDGQLAGSQITRREDGSWLVDAQVEIHDLERALDAGGLAMGSEFTTLAGLILSRLGEIPESGDIVIVNQWRLEIVDVDGNRIDKVIITRLDGRSTGI
jgi:putative hemolysin